MLADRTGDLRVTRTGTDLRIHLPRHAPDAICSVVALKVQGRPVIYEAPQIVATSDRLVQSLAVKLTTRSKDLVIRYTLDGSRITIAGKRVVDNDGLHGAEAKTGTIALAARLHPISIEYFNKTGGGSLSLHWSAADQPLKPVPQAVLKHAE